MSGGCFKCIRGYGNIQKLFAVVLQILWGGAKAET